MRAPLACAAALFAASAAIAASPPVPAKLPAPIKALEAQGLKIIAPFKAGGVQGYAGMLGEDPVAAYLTPDGKHAIVGTMVDAKGNDMTGDVLDRLVTKPVTTALLKVLEQTEWIGDGDPGAPRVVYAFTDPNCGFCHQFWTDSQPWVAAGKVQVRHIIVAILSPSSEGKAAALLAAPDRRAALTRHENGRAEGGITPLNPIPPSLLAKIAANNRLMAQLGMAGTPAILYVDAQGVVRNVQGAPKPETLSEVMGPL